MYVMVKILSLFLLIILLFERASYSRG